MKFSKLEEEREKRRREFFRHYGYSKGKKNLIISGVIICFICIASLFIILKFSSETNIEYKHLAIRTQLYDPIGEPENFEIEWIRIYFEDNSAFFRYHYKPKEGTTSQLVNPKIRFIDTTRSLLDLEEICISDGDLLKLWGDEQLTPIKTNTSYEFIIPEKYYSGFYITFKTKKILLWKTTVLHLDFYSSDNSIFALEIKKGDWTPVFLPEGYQVYDDRFSFYYTENAKIFWESSKYNIIKNFKIMIEKTTVDRSFIAIVLTFLLGTIGIIITTYFGIRR